MTIKEKQTARERYPPRTKADWKRKYYLGKTEVSKETFEKGAGRKMSSPEERAKAKEMIGGKSRFEMRKEEEAEILSQKKFITATAQKGLDIEKEKKRIMGEEFLKSQKTETETETPTSEQREITEEELAGGLTQEDIDAGMSMASIGMVTPITPSDVMALSGIGGLAKTGFKQVALKSSQVALKSSQAYATLLHKIGRKKFIKRQESIERIAFLTKDTIQNVQAIIDHRIANQLITTIAKDVTSKKLAFGSYAIGGAGVLSLAVTLSGADGIIAWYAMDNMATTAKMNTNKLFWKAKEASERGDFEYVNEALALVEIEVAELQAAKDKITMSATWNPAIRAYAKYVKLGMAGDERSIALDIDSISKLQQMKGG